MTARLNHLGIRHRIFYLLAWMLAAQSPVRAQTTQPIKVLVVGANDQYHSPMATAAEAFFQKLAKENPFTVDFSRDFNDINETNLAQYQVFVQLHIAPFDLTPAQQFAIQQFISNGKGWVGVHAAGLTGTQFVKPGQIYWQW